LLEIDGSFGEGGGQILRTSLSLSLITRTPFRIINIRKHRAKPGLRRQHLTAVRAAARIGNAHVEGDAVKSTELTFQPGSVAGGEYDFDIGSGGSTTLVFQTILPALLLAASKSVLTFRGGTHNHGGPPWDFIESVFLPALRSMGARVATRLERHGFAQGGRGEWTAEVLPSRVSAISLRERGEHRTRTIRALVSSLPVAIAEREIATLREAISWPASAFQIESVEAAGPGNIVMISARFANAAELATGFGERGVPAETVARRAAQCWLNYEQSGAPVGEYLADQLLLPLALAGSGSFVTMKPTLHTHTNVRTIGRFLDAQFRIESADRTQWAVYL
jgi:RNA 3'-terminal phosphate cyclase (ATP)